MTCTYCGAVLHGTYCSKCGRRADGSEPQLVPSFAKLKSVDWDLLLQLAWLAVGAIVLFAVPAVGVLAAVIYLGRDVLDR